MQTVKFYNGGDAKYERLSYTAGNFNPKAENGVRYHVMDAPRKGFFEIPREIDTETGGQLLGLPREVMEKYGNRGFVMIDRNVSDAQCADQPYLANSDEMAVKKGDQLWRDYCFKCVQEYEDNNEKRKAMGMAASRPSGFIVHAYKELGMIPPGAEEEKKAKEGKTVIDELKESNAVLQRQVAALLERMPVPAQEAHPPQQPSGKSGKG